MSSREVGETAGTDEARIRRVERIMVRAASQRRESFPIFRDAFSPLIAPLVGRRVKRDSNPRPLGC
jgi:hypothetical protein